MLTGNIIYRPNSSNSYKYKVKAVDISTTFMGKIATGDYSALSILSDSSSEEDNEIWERRFDVNLSSVKVEVSIHTVDNKSIKSKINNDFFCRLASVIRYVKRNCSKQNMVGFTGLELSSGEFEPASRATYKIPSGYDNSESIGTVVLCLGEIQSLNIVTDDFTINLDEDSTVMAEVFKKIKNHTIKGFKVNEEYLGFKIPIAVLAKSSANSGYYSSIEEIVSNHPDKDFSWLLDNDYKIVTDDTLDEVCEMFMAWDDFIYYDTETSGLNITFRSRLGVDQGDQLVGVVLSIRDGESYFFPTQMKSIPNLCGGDHFYFMEHYMKPILEGKKLIAHNMSFDWKVAYIYDINANIVHDTMAMFKLTFGSEKKNFSVKLKELARMFLLRDSLELSNLVVDDSWGESDVRFWDLPYELVRLYACADTDNTRGLFNYAVKTGLLQKYNATKTYEIEIAFSYAVAYQEFYGQKINVDEIEELKTEIDQNIKLCMSKMEEIVGHEFNPNSPQQLVKIMYEDLNIPQQISRKTGRPTTSKEALEYLSELTDINGDIMYPFVSYLQKFRVNEGIRKTIDNFPKFLTPDGYIHSDVQQYGTTTGRVSIKEPNYQSYNDAVKKRVVTRPHYWGFDTDYSSIEYRVLGNMAGNKMIKEGFKDPDFDYHTYQAARIYGVPYATVTKKLRKAAKGINFGLPYGMGDESLGVRVFGEATKENTIKAASLRIRYFIGQEDIKFFFETNRDKGAKQGYTETYFGRRRYYHREDFSEGAIRRQAGNQIIQGTAADIYKLAVGRVFKRICKEGWLGKVLFDGFIHDELFGEVHESIDPVVFLKVLREEFEVKVYDENGEPWCPLYMGFGYGMSWYEAKSVELPIRLQWELVEKYGETGHPDYNGNGREFCNKVPDMLRDFSVRDVRNQLFAPENQGKEIKPALNTSLFSVLNEDLSYYNKGINDFADSAGYNLSEETLNSFINDNKNALIAYLNTTYYIQSLFSDSDGNYVLNIDKAKETQEAIDLFCKLHDSDRSKINVLSVSEVEASDLDSPTSVVLEDLDDDILSEEEQQKHIDARVNTLGLYLNTNERTITLKVIPSVYLNYIKEHSSSDSSGYNIIFKDYENNKTYLTKAYIASKDINLIQSMYLMYFKTIKFNKVANK